jgi:GrpB protein
MPIEVLDYDPGWPATAAAAIAELRRALPALGYRRLVTGMPGRLFYPRDRDGRRAYHLHVVPADTWAARNEPLLRDHLRRHPADARRYGDLKQELAGRPGDAAGYSQAKTELIQELTDRARADRGLPSVPVWEGPGSASHSRTAWQATTSKAVLPGTSGSSWSPARTVDTCPVTPAAVIAAAARSSISPEGSDSTTW